MPLKDKISLYDRHNRGVEGSSVAGPNGTGPLPSDGNFFQDGGNTSSPFSSTMGLKSDQMVDLLENNVTSGNTGITYKPSPQQSPYQDLNIDMLTESPEKYLDNLPT